MENIPKRLILMNLVLLISILLQAQIIDVTDSGAIPNDGENNRETIQQTIAHRKGDSWYVEFISAEKMPFNAEPDLALLCVKNGYILEISDSKGELVANEKSLRNSTYSKEITPYGGVVFIV
ncbi:hypothetical protein INQ51_21740 [Maribellus sp. CM-23]|uniref:hypothetical protein n=1 Tax=Maribellus sp. CM-23 TaxID=2781026 RepID=UPI001F364D27|nr:hypothetical protein [Maribellus sp. CM-23]MCE4566959.1 hypothetical protein [Maribellus sp. CM-23]